MPFVTSSDALVTSSFLLLLVRPGATSRVLGTSSFLLLVMPLLVIVHTADQFRPVRCSRPSYGALASFLSTGIKQDGQLIGVFCTQMPPESKPVQVSTNDVPFRDSGT